MTFIPDFRHHFFGSKIELDADNKSLKHKRWHLSKSEEIIFEYSDIEETKLYSNGALQVLEITVKDIKNPVRKVYFASKAKANIWYLRVIVALSGSHS